MESAVYFDPCPSVPHRPVFDTIYVSVFEVVDLIN